MKVVYNVKPKRGEYDEERVFTYGKEYQIIADYRKRMSGDDGGLVIEDNRGGINMLLPKDVIIIQDDKPCYTFEYKK